MLFEDLSGAILVKVTQRHDVLFAYAADIRRTATADPDAGDVQFFRWETIRLEQPRATDHRQATNRCRLRRQTAKMFDGKLGSACLSSLFIEVRAHPRYRRTLRIAIVGMSRDLAELPIRWRWAADLSS